MDLDRRHSLWLLKAENVWRLANLVSRNEGRATLDDLIFFSFSPVRWDPNRRDNAFFDQSVILHCSYH